MKAAQALRMQTPPAALIFFSAKAENNLALTITGILGRTPLPSTLKKPYIKEDIYINYNRIQPW